MADGPLPGHRRLQIGRTLTARRLKQAVAQAHFQLPHTAILRALIALLVAIFWEGFTALAHNIGVSPLGLTVAVSWLALTWSDTGRVSNQPRVRKVRPRAWILAMILITAVLAYLLFAATDTQAQRLVSLHLAVMGLYYTAISLRDPRHLSDQLLGKGWHAGQVNAVRWLGFIAFGQALLNEAALVLLSDRAWLLAFGLTPIAAYLVMLWAIAVTHPHKG